MTAGNTPPVERQAQDTQEGRVLGNRYRVVRLVGEGGMGKVFLADDLLEEGKRVAVKLVHRPADRSVDPRKQEELEHEAAKTMAILLNEFHSMTSLSHPNVAEAYDFGLDEETNDVFFTTEYVEGTHILRVAKKLRIERAKDLDLFLNLIVQLSRGLGFVHSRGLVHADIKPENILVSGFQPGLKKASDVSVKLIDFGLMKREKAFGGKKIVGTTYYIAPETIRGARVDRRTDLYSLGVVIYHLATGRLPFKGGSNFQVFKGHLEGQATPAHEMNPRVPEQLSHVIARLMEKNPADRYQSAFELIDDLNERMGLTYPLEDRDTRASYLDCIRRGGRESEMTRLRSLFVSAAGSGGLGFDIGEQLSDISDIEIAQVRDLEPTTVPRGRCVILRGERGIGKRQLLSRLAHQAQTRGAMHVDLDCRGERDRPHATFNKLLSILWGLEGPVYERNAPEYLREAEELRKRVENRARRFRRGVVESGTSAIARGLASVSQRRSLLLCLQNVHLAGELTKGVIDHLVSVLGEGKFPDAQILVVCTTLDHGDTEGSAFEELYESSFFRRSILELKIERLERVDAVKLIRSTFDPCDFSDELLDRLFVESDGNPDLLAGIFEDLLTNRRVRRTAQGWSVFGDIDRESLPGKMRVKLEARIERLPRHALNLAVAFASLGHTAELSVALRLSGVPDEAVDGALRVLRREKILEQRVEGDPGETYSFVHSSARDLLYGRIPVESRPTIHASAGTVYEEYYSTAGENDPRTLAYHFLRSSDPAKAIEYGTRAARELSAKGRPVEAIELYRRVLSFVNDEGGHQWSELVTELSKLLLDVGSFAEVVTMLAPICLVETTGGGQRVPGFAYIRLAKALAHSGDFEKATLCLQLMSRRIDLVGEPEVAAEALLASAELHAAKGNVVESLRCCDRLRSVVAKATRFEQNGAVEMVLAENHFRLDNSDVASKHCQDAIRLSESRDNLAKADLNLFYLGKYYKYRGKLDRAIQQFEMCLVSSRRAGMRPQEARCLLEIGYVHQLCERPREALPAFEQAVAIFTKMKDVAGLSEALCALGETHRLLGEYEEACRILNTAIECAERVSNAQAVSRALLAFSGLHIDKGDLENSSGYLAASSTRDTSSTLAITIKHLELKFYQALYRGDLASALDCTTESLAVCAQGQNHVFVTKTLAQRGMLLCRLGSRHEARRIVVRLLDIAREHGFPLSEGRARLVEGMVRVGEGNSRLAAKSFREAEDIFRAQTSERELVELYAESGMFHLMEGDQEQAYLHFEEGVYLAKKLNLDYLKARFLFALGVLELATIPDGSLDNAMKRLLSAERLASRAPFHEVLWHVQYHLCRLFELTDQPERAEAYASKWREHKQATSEMVPSNQLGAFLKVSARDDLDELIESRLAAVQEVEVEAVELA